MGKENTPATPVKAEAKKTERKVLTPEQRVAKLEAELAAARKKAEDKANKQINEAKDKRAKLVEKRDALNVQILELTEIIGDDASQFFGEGASSGVEAKAS